MTTNSLASFSHGEGIFNCQKFLNILVNKETKELVKDCFNISDKQKRQLAEVLCNQWMLYRDERTTFYVKHVPSGKKNLLYQILLSGSEEDGVYEFLFKNRTVATAGLVLDGRHVLSVNSNGNYALATFSDAEVGNQIHQEDDYFEDGKTICRANYASDKAFCEALLSHGFVTEQELEEYYRPNEMLMSYLDRKLPRILFSANKLPLDMELEQRRKEKLSRRLELT